MFATCNLAKHIGNRNIFNQKIGITKNNNEYKPFGECRNYFEFGYFNYKMLSEVFL